MLKDTSIMPWGKYRGTKMANVPANYLLFLHEENKLSGNVLQYVQDNLDVIKKQTNQKGISIINN